MKEEAEQVEEGYEEWADPTIKEEEQDQSENDDEEDPPPAPSLTSSTSTVRPEMLHVNDHRRPSKLNIQVTTVWNNDATHKGEHFRKGYLNKKGGGTSFLGRRSWQARYFVLSDTSFGYWKKKEDFENSEKPIKNSTFDITGCVVDKVNSEKYKGKFLFKIRIFDKAAGKLGLKELVVSATTESDREAWGNLLSIGSNGKNSDVVAI